MKKHFLLITLTLLTYCLASQTLNETDEGLLYIDLETQDGTVTAIIPSKIHAGDVISGTVIAEPKGRNERQIARNSQTISGYVIELEEDKQTLESGKVNWKIPATIAGGVATLLLKDNQGKVLSRTQITVSETPRLQSVADGAAIPDFKLPDFVRAGQTEMITGPFDGSMDNSSVILNDVELNILAESPEGIFVEIPENISGRSEIIVAERDRLASTELNIVNMQLSADKLTLSRGERAVVTIDVRGLEEMETDIPVKVTNLTPGSIAMAGGNYQEIIIRPEDAAHTGAFQEKVEVTASRSGAFSVLVEIEKPDTRMLNLLYPEEGTLVENNAPEFVWNTMGFPNNTNYDLFLYALPDDTGFQPELLADMEPVYIARGLRRTSHVLPVVSGLDNYETSEFAYRIIANDGLSGDVLGDESSGFYTISTRNRCRCGNQSGTLTANLKSGNTTIALVSLSRRPSVISVPQGPLTLEIIGADLNCGECRRTECQVRNITYNPARPVINATNSIQTLEVEVTWNCVLDDCQPDTCTQTFTFRYRLAPDNCFCGDVGVTVEAINIEAKNPLNRNTRSRVVSHRPARSSGSDVIRMDGAVRFEEGDVVQIRISGIDARCWCRHGQCIPEPSERQDIRDNRPVTIDLGENDPDASNDNHNMVRVKRNNDGWQNDGSYVLHAQFRNQRSLERSIYQDFTLKYWCDQADCSRSYCREKFRIHFGAF